MKMNLQTLSPVGFGIVFIFFFACFVGSVVVGVFLAPHVFNSQTSEVFDLQQNWTGTITGLTKLHQQLLLRLHVNNSAYQSIGVTKNIDLMITIESKTLGSDPWAVIYSSPDPAVRTIVCSEGSQECSSTTIVHEPFIEYPTYRVNVSASSEGENPFLRNATLAFYYVNDDFTIFELWFRFFFLATTILVFGIFAWKLRGYPWSNWSIEQKWVTTLLFGLIAYNNPFFALEIILDHWVPVFMDIVMLVSFLVLLLLFWLVMFDGIHRDNSSRTLLFFYGPKVFLVGAIWVLGVVAYTLLELEDLANPTASINTIHNFLIFKIIMLVLLALYGFYIAYVICRTFGVMINVIRGVENTPFLGVRVRFFAFLTLIIFAIICVGLIGGYLSPQVQNSPAEITSFSSLFNLYVYTLVFVYLPSKSAGDLTAMETDLDIELETDTRKDEEKVALEEQSDEFDLDASDSSSD